MTASNPLRNTALYLAVIQFLFVTSWVIYVIFLGDLLESVGLGRELVIWFIMLDQAVFALTDTAMGFAADRVERMIGRLGPLIIGVNSVSCIAFLLLPFSAELGTGVAAQAVFIALIVIWIGTSSVLRAPPIVLLMKHAARPRAPKLTALILSGLALGGAFAPYLNLTLNDIDPRIPFIMTSVTLLLVTLGLSRMEHLVRAESAPAQPPRADAGKATSGGRVVLLLVVSGRSTDCTSRLD